MLERILTNTRHKEEFFEEFVDFGMLCLINYSPVSVVTVVQSVERQIVILVVVGSIPIGHPIFNSGLIFVRSERY